MSFLSGDIVSGKAAPLLAKLTAEQIVALVQASPLIHFAGYVTIEDKEHTRIRPVPNVLQYRIAEAYEWCIANGIPPRIMVLKPRQKGSSTFCGHVCYHHARRFHCDGMIIGDEADRTKKVWHMFWEYAANDRFPWDSKSHYNEKRGFFNYRDGSKGEWEHDTANDPKAGISGTRQVIWYTEAARYAKSGARTDVKVITASLNSLAKVPHSLAFAESTADGAGGWFYDNWQSAATFEQVKAGDYQNGWIRIFAAWFEFPDASLPRTPQNERWFAPELDSEEKRGVELYKWTPAQIAWRRSQIANECAGDVRMFNQDFPSDDESCFLSSGRARFNLDGVSRLEVMAKNEHSKAEIGVIEKQGGGVGFIPRAEDGWVWMQERPKDGRGYLAFIDGAMGEQSKGAKDPDAHGAGILGDAYQDRNGVVHPPELVAAIHVPNGCRWDPDLIGERLAMLADYFGGCMVVPEINGPGLAIVQSLRKYGALIYQRIKQDHVNPGKRLQVPGWETTSLTREIWVSALADAIREQDFNCRYLPAVKEFKTFYVDDRGKAAAKAGTHDDWCAGIGIGLACIRFSSIYRKNMPVVRSIPSSHADHWATEQQAASAFS